MYPYSDFDGDLPNFRPFSNNANFDEYEIEVRPTYFLNRPVDKFLMKYGFAMNKKKSVQISRQMIDLVY